jgi:hypothetical protein
VKRVSHALLLVLSWLAVSWLGVGPRVARAEPRHTAIALVSGGADAELHARLRAELVGIGWRVKEMPPGGDLALAQVARRAGTLAVLRVGRSAEGIEVWVAPEVDSEARSEWIDVDARRPELAVLRAVEALRARFLELGIEPEDLRGEPTGSEANAAGTPPPAGTATGSEKRPSDSKQETQRVKPAPAKGETGSVEPELEPLPLPSLHELPHAPHALWLAANGGIVSASKELGPGTSLNGAVRYVYESRWGVDLSVWWPPTAARVTRSEGSADIRAALFALGGEFRDRRSVWTLAAGGGGALVWLNMTGSPEKARIVAQDANVFTAMPFGRGAVELELARRLHLRLEGTLGFCVHNAHVLFDQTTVATWGRPFLAGTLGLEWAALGD